MKPSSAMILVAILAMAVGGCGDADTGAGTVETDTSASDTSILGACTGDLDCEDANPCTTDVCGDDGICRNAPVAALTACDDANACTTDDVCDVAGTCAGAAVVLPTEPCVSCGCDPVEGVQCSAAIAGGVCDDGDCCTATDRCADCDPDDAGCNAYGTLCVGGKNPCDDDETCTVDRCSCGVDGAACAYEPVADDTVCVADPNACAEPDRCQQGECVGGAPLDLNDANPCTRDSCVKGEIVHDPLSGGQCDDGDLCTENDICQLGTCVGGAPVECVKPTCASSVSCVSAEGCVPIWLPAGALCDDGDACSVAEACDAAHACVPTQETSIDDGNPCTVDACDPETGLVSHTIRPGTCDDGDPCTFGDVCDAAGMCAGTARTCPADNNPCTQDVCGDDGACGVAQPDGTPMPDGDLCDGTETCEDGVVTDGTAVRCVDDSNPCTDDVCDATDGSCGVNRDNGTEVPDADLCDGTETCQDGVVTDGAAVRCGDDGNPCTDDVCDPADGSCGVNREDDTAVPDADLCDGTETCQDGVVTDGAAVRCVDDSNPCTDDVCDPADGSCGVNREDDTEVPDADLCDGTETCQGGVVTDGAQVRCIDDSNPCTDDVCDSADGSCGVNREDGTAVPDADLCDGTETCQNGVVTNGSPVSCPDDGNACTLDQCNTADGSCGIDRPDGAAAPDDDLCDGAETCLDGQVSDGSPVRCPDDGNRCVVDICDPADGSCGVPRTDGPFPDTDLCDGEESCVGGVEMAGSRVTCEDDSNPCTVDTCNDTDGTCGVDVTDGTEFPDGDLCDGTEVCEAGELVDGTMEMCDDGDDCTTASCLSDGSCEQRYTCVTQAADTVVYAGLPALAANGTVVVASRKAPVNSSAAQGSLNRITRVSGLASATLTPTWGPKAMDPRCDNNGGAGRTSAISDALGAIFMYGDWNDGANDYCASLFSYGLADGSRNWSTSGGGPHPRHDIALSDSEAFYGGWTGEIYRYRQTDGVIDATMDLNSGSSHGGKIVLLSGGDMVATQTSFEVERWTPTGTRVWTRTTATGRHLTVSINDALIGWHRGTATLVKLDPANGDAVWNVSMPGDSPVLADADGNLYLAAEDMAVSLDDDGVVRWTVGLNGAGVVQFLGDDDRFYIASPDTLYAIDMMTGEIAWQMAVHPDPVSVNGAMVANTFSHVGTLLVGGDFFIGDHGGRNYRLALGIDYASAPWARPRGNRANTGRVWDLVP